MRRCFPGLAGCSPVGASALAPPACMLCRRADVSAEVCGPTHREQGLCVHEFCLVSCPRGSPCSPQQRSLRAPCRAPGPSCFAVSRQRAGAAQDRAGRDLRIPSCRHQKNNKERRPEGEDPAGTGSFVPRPLGLSRGVGLAVEAQRTSPTGAAVLFAELLCLRRAWRCDRLPGEGLQPQLPPPLRLQQRLRHAVFQGLQVRAAGPRAGASLPRRPWCRRWPSSRGSCLSAPQRRLRAGAGARPRRAPLCPRCPPLRTVGGLSAS